MCTKKGVFFVSIYVVHWGSFFFFFGGEKGRVLRLLCICLYVFFFSASFFFFCSFLFFQFCIRSVSSIQSATSYPLTPPPPFALGDVAGRDLGVTPLFFSQAILNTKYPPRSEGGYCSQTKQNKTNKHTTTIFVNNVCTRCYVPKTTPLVFFFFLRLFQGLS